MNIRPRYYITCRDCGKKVFTIFRVAYMLAKVDYRRCPGCHAKAGEAKT